MKTYLFVTTISKGRTYPGIQCVRCGRISYNVNDIAQKYCGFCHRFHDDPAPRGRNDV